MSIDITALDLLPETEPLADLASLGLLQCTKTCTKTCSGFTCIITDW